MNDKQWQQVEAQLPKGTKILKKYRGFEDGSTRIVVMLPGAQFETRYFVHFEGEDVRIEHRP